jgi:AraC family transcriptional activator of pobA
MSIIHPMNKIPVRHINEPALNENFIIRKVEALLSGKDMVQELHRHDFFFVLALEKGKGEHIIDFIPYSIRNYSVFFMKPGQVHRLTLKKGSKGFMLQFKTNFSSVAVQNLLQKVSSTNYYQFDLSHFKKILLALHSVFVEYTDKHEQYQQALKANLEIFLIELARKNYNLKKILLVRGSYAQARLDDLLELIEGHLRNKKQVAQYAAMMNLTTYQLNAITKETLGKTCSEVVNEHITLEAKRYLLATHNQVSQIAYDLGYEDVSYFIRFFKKHTGHSPQTFRENFK